MEELLVKIENLKNELDNDKRVVKIHNLNKKIHSNSDLSSKIKEYRLSNSELIKKEIIDNALFKEYKQAETDINILILEINQRLKQINKKGQCRQ